MEAEKAREVEVRRKDREALKAIEAREAREVREAIEAMDTVIAIEEENEIVEVLRRTTGDPLPLAPGEWQG